MSTRRRKYNSRDSFCRNADFRSTTIPSSPSRAKEHYRHAQLPWAGKSARTLRPRTRRQNGTTTPSTQTTVHSIEIERRRTKGIRGYQTTPSVDRSAHLLSTRATHTTLHRRSMHEGFRIRGAAAAERNQRVEAHHAGEPSINRGRNTVRPDRGRNHCFNMGTQESTQIPNVRPEVYGLHRSPPTRVADQQEASR